MKHFHDEAGRQKVGDLFTNGSSLLFGKSTEGLTDRLGVLADVEFVLGVLPRDTRHVFGGPCEDIQILTEEVDELAFLFAVEASAHDNVLAVAGAFRVQLHFLGLLGGLEVGLVGRVLGWD